MMHRLANCRCEEATRLYSGLTTKGPAKPWRSGKQSPRLRLHLQMAIAALVLALSNTSTHASTIIPDTTIIIGANSAGPYWVSGFFIIKDSEHIRANSTDPLSHTIDPNNGRINFDRALTPQDTIVVTFQRLGFALRSHWSLESSTQPTQTAGVIPVSYVVPGESNLSPLRNLPSPSRLQWQGHKSFSVTASEATSTDWSQGMELSVEGELLKGLTLSAALSDRQVGTGSRNSSRDGSRLGDLERFYIEAQSSRFRGRWGELRLDQRGTSSRRVSGLQTRVSGNQHTFESFVARPQGETRRIQIAVREGVHGPYALSGTSAQANIVDGSQSVWLDGNRLTEGRDGDYTIDPVRGTITLTPHVTVSRQSQFVIEYEESLDDYQRTMVGSTWGWHSSDSALQQAFSFVWEGDDPNQPIFGSLTNEQKDILGSSPQGIVSIPAAERVGDHDGDYTLAVHGDVDSVFAYAGPDQGDWDVRFQWVGESKGRYRHLIDNVYEFVGEGKGPYDPTLTLNAPAAEATVEESLRLRTKNLGSLTLDWQGIGVDPNRFSSGSSASYSNHVFAWTLGDRASQQRTRASLNWIRQSQRSSNRQFGLGLAGFGEDWRLHGDRLDDRYDHFASSVATPIADWFALQVDAGRFSQSALDGWRSGTHIQLKPIDWLMLEQSAHGRWISDASATDSRTTFLQSLVRTDLKQFTVEAARRSEDVDDPSRVFTYTTDANLSHWISVSRDGFIARQEWRRAHDRELDRIEYTRESSIGLPSRLLGATAGSGLAAVRGEQSIGDSEFRPYYGGRLNSIWIPRDNLQISADIVLTHRRAGSQREVFIPTRPGQGDYRFERGEYIPDPQGDYRRVYVEDEEPDASAYDAVKNIRINWRPNWQGWRWSIDASRRIDARYSTAAFAPTEWMVPWAELTGALASGARLATRDDHRITVQPRLQSRATVTFTHEHMIARPTGSANDDQQRFVRIETEWREEVSRKSYVAATAQFHRRTRDGSPLAAIDSDARALLMTIGHSPAPGIGVAVEGRRRIDREFAATQSLGLWGIKPTARISIGALSSSLATDFTWLDGEDSGYLSPLLSEGRPLGFSFTESAEVHWQLPSRISLNARLSGDHRPNEPDRWRMHIETVATF